MIDKSPVTEEELHAYVDGELAADRRAAVEAWLSIHPDAAALTGSWRLQRELINARYGSVGNEPVPARLSLDRLLRDDRKWIRAASAAAIAAFVIGGGAGWFGRGLLAGSAPAPSLMADALEAYRLYVVEVRHPVEVPGGEAVHLVQWLSKRLDYELRAPELSAMGLKLVGGRLLPGPTGRPAAFFMYEGPSGERFTLYCAKAGGPETALRYDAIGQVAAFSWIGRNIGYVVSGPADRERLLKVAQTAYDQIDSARGKAGNS